MAINLKDNELLQRRSAGVLLPLSAMRGATDWGCGDMASFREWINYLGGEGIKIIQILPISESAPAENCPYSTLSAYALDPVYISIEDVPEVRNSPAAREITASLRDEIAYWRGERAAQFKYIKAAKYKTMWAAYEYFLQNEQAQDTRRYNDFLAFQQKNNGWLVPYTIFRTAKDLTGWSSWKHWENPFKNTDINFLKNFALNNGKQMMFFTYLQWVLQQQLDGVRQSAVERGVVILGDIPFGVSYDSADVWANQRKYMLEAEIGAPGDNLAEGGQKWGLPAYNWAEIDANNFNLWRGRIKRCCELYDAFRLDHLVGFFRTWVFEQGQDKGHYDLQDEYLQKVRGERFLEAVVESAGGKLPIGEDLGVIPDYLRELMKEINLPGYKVLRWEKDNEIFRDPSKYPAASLATTSTHDTQMLKEWWESMPDWQRANAWEMISGGKSDGKIPFDAQTRRAILKRVLGSGSCMVVLPLQDIIGSAERINTPGTVNADNWTYRAPYETAEFHSKYLNEMREFTELIKETGRD
jgi:4-alpha-glucanotransferase